MDDDNYFGTRLRKMRLARGLTLKDLASRMGRTHFTTVAKLESGKMQLSADWIRLLAEGLGVTPFEIIADEAAPNAVRAVPLFMPYDARVGGPPEGALQLGWTPTAVDGTDLFGVLLEEMEAPSLFDSNYWTMIIDPNLRTLKDGGMYAMRLLNDGKLGIAVYRAEPAGMYFWPNPDDFRELGSFPFETIGRVVQQTREVGTSKFS